MLTIKPKKGDRIPEGDLAYQRARTQFRMHSMLLEAFARSGIKQADLARMLDKKPEVVNRVLGEAANYNLDTLSDYLFALCGSELSDAPLELHKGDESLPPWLKPEAPKIAPADADDDAVTILLKA